MNQRTGVLTTAIFYAVLAFYGLTALHLVRSLPRDFPYGGPDEAMHLSVSNYIAGHWHWPNWDSRELLRYPTGTSYASASSFGYWLAAISSKVTGSPRLAGLMLFYLLLAGLAWLHWRRPLLGWIGLAGMTPQVPFLFSYVNTEAWSIFIAACFGCALSWFSRRGIAASVVAVLVLAAACLTCRQHLWVLGGLAFFWIAAWNRRVFVEQRKAVLIGLVPALLIASWWPVTSYMANAGDPVGFAAARRAREKFARPDAPKLAVPLDQVDWPSFISDTAKSLYGIWGHMYQRLEPIFYLAALVFGLGLVGCLLWICRDRIVLSVLLISTNLALMVYYSTTYDYQPQGRYLLPTVALLWSLWGSDLLDRWEKTSASARALTVTFAAGFLIVHVASIVWLSVFWAAFHEAHRIR